MQDWTRLVPDKFKKQKKTLDRLPGIDQSEQWSAVAGCL